MAVVTYVSRNSIWVSCMGDNYSTTESQLQVSREIISYEKTENAYKTVSTELPVMNMLFSLKPSALT